MLTERQEQVVKTIWKFLLERGRYPSIREIARIIGVSSLNGVMCHIVALEKKGALERGTDSKASHKEPFRLVGVVLEPTIDKGEAGDSLRKILEKADSEHAAK